MSACMKVGFAPSAYTTIFPRSVKSVMNKEGILMSGWLVSGVAVMFPQWLHAGTAPAAQPKSSHRISAGVPSHATWEHLRSS